MKKKFIEELKDDWKKGKQDKLEELKEIKQSIRSLENMVKSYRGGIFYEEKIEAETPNITENSEINREETLGSKFTFCSLCLRLSNWLERHQREVAVINQIVAEVSVPPKK